MFTPPRAESTLEASASTSCGSWPSTSRSGSFSPARSIACRAGPSISPSWTTSWSPTTRNLPRSSPVSRRTAASCVRRLTSRQRFANSSERMKRSSRSRTNDSTAAAIGVASGAARGGSRPAAKSAVRVGSAIASVSLSTSRSWIGGSVASGATVRT